MSLKRRRAAPKAKKAKQDDTESTAEPHPLSETSASGNPTVIAKNIIPEKRSAGPIQVANNGTAYNVRGSANRQLVNIYLQANGQSWNTSGADLLVFALGLVTVVGNLTEYLYGEVRNNVWLFAANTPVGEDQNFVLQGRYSFPAWTGPGYDQHFNSGTENTWPVLGGIALQGVRSQAAPLFSQSNWSRATIEMSTAPMVIDRNAVIVSFLATDGELAEAPAGYQPSNSVPYNNASNYGMQFAWRSGWLTTENPVWRGTVSSWMLQWDVVFEAEDQTPPPQPSSTSHNSVGVISAVTHEPVLGAAINLGHRR